MAKNLIFKAIKLLNVEVGEKFDVVLEGQKSKNTYFFTEDGYLRDEFNYAHPQVFVALLAGKAELIKRPWKPNDGEEYWTFSLLTNRGKPSYWGVLPVLWRAFPAELALQKLGWVYHTKEEAEAALPQVAKELGVEYEN